MLFGKQIVGVVRWRWFGGELLVVIIGVLVALSIEQAWSDRQDRNLELDYLKSIRNSVQADIKFVDEFSQVRTKRKMDAIEAVGPVVRGFAPMPDDLEQFLRNVGKAAIGGVSPTYAVRREVFEDLISTGNLRLLRDPEIRTAIRSYYRSYDIRFQRTVERLTGYPEFVLGILPTELRDDLDQAAMATFNIDRAIEMIMSDQFETLLNREHNLAIFMEWSDADFLASAREFLHNLEQHISQLEGARS